MTKANAAADILDTVAFTTTIRLACTYFGVVFSTGFVFGIIRQLYVIPKFQLRSSSAEIIEAPVTFVAVIVWARWLIHRYKIPAKTRVRLAVGLLGLGLMTSAELTGNTLVGERNSSAEREHERCATVARALYLFDLMVFGLMPWLLLFMEWNMEIDGASSPARQPVSRRP